MELKKENIIKYIQLNDRGFDEIEAEIKELVTELNSDKLFLTATTQIDVGRYDDPKKMLMLTFTPDDQ